MLTALQMLYCLISNHEVETDQKSEIQNPKSQIIGVAEQLHDLVVLFDHATIANTSNASASQTDQVGGVIKPAVFEHPNPSGDSEITYRLTLPKSENNDQLIFHFFIGLRDGINFDNANAKTDGVKFAIAIDGRRIFDGFSDRCEWQENFIDLSDFAGKEIDLTLITNAGGHGNTNYDWALWGEPRLIKLIPIETYEDFDLHRGIAITTFKNSEKSLSKISQLEKPKSIAAIADELAENDEITKVEVYADQPVLEIDLISTPTSIVPAGGDFDVQCRVKNIGNVPITDANSAAIAITRLKLRRGRSRQKISQLDPGEETTLSWSIRRFPRPTTANVTITLSYNTIHRQIEFSRNGQIEINTALPRLPKSVEKQLHAFELDGHVITGNQHFRSVFVRGDRGFEYVLLYILKNGNYQQIGVCPSIAMLSYRNADGEPIEIKITPQNYKLGGNSDGESIVILSENFEDADGGNWTFESKFITIENNQRIKVVSKISVDQPRDLLNFSPINLHAGEGSFGSEKSFAIFPGLEFLEGDERSSSTRDAAPPINNRLVPHPYKITIPLMAIENRKTLIGVIWNPLQKWDGKNETPAAMFASPNWHENRQNHLMRLFVPTPIEWMHENETSASTPYQLSADHPITLSAEIIIGKDRSILDAISEWTDAFDLPKPLTPPRDDIAEMELSRHGFMHTVWDESTQKSRHCVDWSPMNAPGFATLLWNDYLVSGNREVKDRVETIAQNTIRDSGESGLVSEAGCHILKWEFPFYYGGMGPAIDHLREMSHGLIRSQRKDGSWRFRPQSDRTKTLGTAGDAVLGTEAISAFKLLKFARIANDRDALDAGLKALKFMDKFAVPRGAQGWECPIYEPDILASAYAIAAYVEAYAITNEKSFLKKAEFWAETGLPFLYFWHLPDRPGMHYATIPVFGTTFYTHSWFGVPVQWCGLVYAYHLQRLAKLSDRQNWKQIAEGITISAMFQQWEDGDLKGTLPDGFYGYCTDRKGPHINPEDIMVNLFALRGHDPDISTAIIQNPKRIHLSSGAKIKNFNAPNSDQLRFTLRYVPNETTYSLIVGLDRKPIKLIVDKKNEIVQTDDLNSVESGWNFDPKKDRLLIKHKTETEESTFNLIFSEISEKSDGNEE